MKAKVTDTSGVIKQGTLAGFKEGTTLTDVMKATYNAMPASFRAEVSSELIDDLPNFGQVLYDYDPDSNAFFNQLINRIGRVNINYRMFNNPLSILKKGVLAFGDTIEDIYINPAKALLFTNQPDNTNAGDVWEVFKPDLAKVFYKINKEFVYPESISTRDIRKAFVSLDELDRFISGIINAIYLGDEIDDFALSVKILSDYGNVNGVNNYYRVKVDDVTDETSAKAFVKAVRGMIARLKFPSTKYNRMGVVNFARPENLYLFVTPELMAEIDVDVLARAFNMDKTTLMGRVTEIPDFGDLADTVALLVDENFMQIWDTYLAMKSTGENARHLYINYFFHHHGIFAASPLWTAVQFTTKALVKPTTVTITGAASMTKGSQGAYSASVTDGASGEIATQAVVWSVADTGTADPNGTQYVTVDQSGTVYVDKRYKGTQITLTATSVEDDTIKGTKNITIS